MYAHKIITYKDILKHFKALLPVYIFTIIPLTNHEVETRFSIIEIGSLITNVICVRQIGYRRSRIVDL